MLMLIALAASISQRIIDSISIGTSAIIYSKHQHYRLILDGALQFVKI